MSDMQDRIERLATEAEQRADVAGVQAAWQEGRAHGLREASAAVAAAADTRTLRDDLRYYEGSRCALFQAAEDLRALLDADESEEGGDEQPR